MIYFITISPISIICINQLNKNLHRQTQKICRFNLVQWFHRRKFNYKKVYDQRQTPNDGKRSLELKLSIVLATIEQEVID